jgi:hypothetical protein
MMRLDEQRNQVVIGKWEKHISAGGCHLNENDKEAAQVGFVMISENMINESNFFDNHQVR